MLWGFYREADILKSELYLTSWFGYNLEIYKQVCFWTELSYIHGLIK